MEFIAEVVLSLGCAIVKVRRPNQRNETLDRDGVHFCTFKIEETMDVKLLTVF